MKSHTKTRCVVVAGTLFLLVWCGATSAQAPERRSQDGSASSAVPHPQRASAEAAGRQPGEAGFGGGLIWLLGSKALHEELNLTEEQSARLKKIAEKFRGQAGGAPGSDDGRFERSREEAVQRAQEVKKEVTAVLDPSRIERLKQIELQQRVRFAGPTVLLQPEFAQTLQLSSEQTQELARLGEEVRKSRRDFFQEMRGLSLEERGRKTAERRQEMQRLVDEAHRKATAGLSAGQKEKLAQLLGKPFDLQRAGPQAQPRRDTSSSPRPAPARGAGERSETRGSARVIERSSDGARPTSNDSVKPSGEKGRLGVGFLIGRKTEELIPLLSGETDFLEMMLGPEKLRYINSLKSPARAMCIAESLDGVARAVRILQEAGIAPDHVYIAYNPEPRPPGARQCTPQEELDDYLGSLKKARALVADYGAPLVMGPGLSEMAKREHLYPEMAKHCDIWMIQSQRLQLDLETDQPVPVERYREEVERIVALLRQGNPDIRVFVQIVPLQATPERREVFTAERLASCVLAVEDSIDAVKIYGGNTELIAEVIQRVRAKRPAPPNPPGAAAGPLQKRTETVEMRDGARLATDLYLPASAPGVKEQEPVPVVLIRTPYNKDSGNAALQRWRDCLLDNGYAVVVQDMRGFYASATEGRAGAAQYDGYDTIEWLAEQPWCTGKVGMMGFSHLGAAQYEAAVTEPPHLACAIPAQAPGNYYTDSLYPPKFRKADMETILRRTFTSKTDVLLNTRIRRQGESKIEQFNVPMLHSAGWYDFFKEGAIEMFGGVRRQGGPGARDTQKLLIGPWGHGVLQEENYGQPLELPGGLAYPANAKLDWEKEVWLPWFDHWLKGKPTGVMDQPAVKYYLMGDVDNPEAPGNRWIEADRFPPKSVSTPYYIHSDHTLSTEPPSAKNAFIPYEYDPTNPVPTVGRVHARVAITGPYDQREVETRRDVLVFTTPELETPLKIVGRIQAKLWASSDRKDTDFTVKLTDVYPDGRSMIFLDGIVKGRFRNTYLEEEFLEPGEVVPFDIDLGFIAIVLAPGHRLRVAISSSNFDRWDINPNTGEPYGEHAVTQSLLAERLRVDSFRDEPQYTASLVATNTVFMDASRPSHVLLPIPVEEPTASGVRERSSPEARQATFESLRNKSGRAATIGDLRYGDSENGVSNLLDLYLPETATGKLPVIVAIHGGGFATGSKAMFRPKAIALVKHGYAVAAINYRLKPQHYLPTQIHDAKAAIRWLRAHAG